MNKQLPVTLMYKQNSTNTNNEFGSVRVSNISDARISGATLSNNKEGGKRSSNRETISCLF